MKLSASLILFGISVAGLPATAATLTSGHVDIVGIGYDAGGFDLHTHVELGGVVDGVPETDPAGTEYAPGDITVQTSTTTVRPASSVWNPIGVAAGESYWILPQANIPGQPFVGIGAEELVPGEWTSPITITLTAMTGPGQFSLNQGAGSPTFFMSTLNGISAADSYSMDLSVDDHAHFNWAFTELGDYTLTFLVSGTHVADGFQSASATYNFSMIPEPSSALLGALGALALLRRRRN